MGDARGRCVKCGEPRDLEGSTATHCYLCVDDECPVESLTFTRNELDELLSPDEEQP